jgi:hypothetical protein
MGDVVDGPWQRGSADLDAVDDDLLPELAPDPYGHEVELYEAPLRHPSQPRAVVSTKSLRAVYSFWFHLFKSVVYLWRLAKAFIRGVALTTPALYRFYRVMHKHETAWIAKSNGQTGEARKAEDAQRFLFWVRLVGTVVVLGTVLYFSSTRLGEVVGTTQDGLRITLYAMGGVALLTLIIIGARATDEPIVDGPAPRQRGDMTEDTINRAMRATSILLKPTRANPTPGGVHIAMLPRHEDGGNEVVFDLPDDCGKSFEDVRKKRDQLAAAYAVPVTHLMLDPGLHAAQVKQWVASRDPFDPARPIPTPLLDEDAWSVFWGVPFGQDPRGQDLTVPIVGTHFLVGALPGAGKTMSARDIAAGVILDPFAKLFIFDGKMGKDWKAAQPIAEAYEAGPIERQCEALRNLLVRFIAEGDTKFQRMQALSDEDCPENKITPQMHARGFGYQMLVIDEVHRHLSDPAYGAEITDLLIRYVQGYRAVGYGLLLATQRPDSKTSESFTKLRDVIGSRLALRVIDWRTSNMILGDSMNTRGYDAALIGQSQLGVGIFRADMDADGRTDKVAHTVRSYYMDNADWTRICQRGAALRREYAPEDIVDAEVIEIPAAQTVPELILAIIHEAGGEMEPAALQGSLAPFIPDLPTDPGRFGRWLNERQLGSVKRGGRRVVELPSTYRPLAVPHPSEFRPGGRNGGRSWTPPGPYVDGTPDGINEDI